MATGSLELLINHDSHINCCIKWSKALTAHLSVTTTNSLKVLSVGLLRKAGRSRHKIVIWWWNKLFRQPFISHMVISRRYLPVYHVEYLFKYIFYYRFYEFNPPLRVNFVQWRLKQCCQISLGKTGNLVWENTLTPAYLHKVVL